jgi:uncharacterized protein YeaO (DUF488 family)
MTMIRIECGYDTVSATDGTWFPVDRLWPREPMIFSLHREEVEI